MKESEVFRRIMRGELLLVGEYRGGKAVANSYVDRKTGNAMTRVLRNYVVECSVAGAMPLVKIVAPVEHEVTDPETVVISLVKGKRYAFPILTLNIESQIATARLGMMEPFEVEPD